MARPAKSYTARQTRPLVHSLLPAHDRPFQFMNMQVFAVERNPRGMDKGTGTRRDATRSIADIIGELLRLEPEHYLHLTARGLERQDPVTLDADGKRWQEMKAWRDAHIDQVRDNWAGQTWKEKEGRTVEMRFAANAPVSPGLKLDVPAEGKYTTLRKQNPKIPTLLGVVCSYPGPPDDEDPDYVLWKALVVKWARKEWGANVVGVYEHRDEPHGHIHCIIALPNAKPIKGLHACHRERMEAEARGEDPSTYGLYYRLGGIKAQERFHKEVGEPLKWDLKGELNYKRYDSGEARARRQLDLDAKALDDRYQAREAELAADYAKQLEELDAQIAANREAAAAIEAKRQAHLNTMATFNQMQLAWHKSHRQIVEKLQAEEAKLQAQRAAHEEQRRKEMQEVAEAQKELTREQRRREASESILEELIMRREELTAFVSQALEDDKIDGEAAKKLLQLIDPETYSPPTSRSALHA